MRAFLDSPASVIRCLVTYSDAWQPLTASTLRTCVTAKRKGFPETVPRSINTLDERTELCRRISLIDQRDRYLLFLWYVQQLSAADVAKSVGISRRQCFRRRANAIRRLVELAEPRATA